MAGKKKKNMANRLAKMSDDERARFLQHKADMEEEAKKRKEQLISTFMKKKIKKEDGFSRLNLAKINQNWHQILRKAKCGEMRKNVEHMKDWMDRIYEYKNRVIEKLMVELEEAEEQYSYNFNAHSTHIQNIMEEQHKYIDKLHSQYDLDLECMVEQNNKEVEHHTKTLEDRENILKTIKYTQSTIASTNIRRQWEGYMLKLNEEKQLFNEKLKDLKTSKALVSSSLWKEIAQVIRVYVEQTDLRRMHFVELKCLDKESLEEIGKNQELIGIEESEIDRLNLRYEQLYTTKEGKIKILSSELEDLNHAYLKLRQKLKTDLALDKSQLMLCTSLGEETIAKVKEDRILGEQLMVLVKACQKFETEKERILKWAPMIKINLKEFGDLTLVKDIRKPEPQAPMVEKLDENNLKSCFDNLQSLENFWQTYNKVNIDFLESKQESKMLQNENKELRGMIRAILETALLNNSIPNTRASTRAPSRMRSAFSAPQRLYYQWYYSRKWNLQLARDNVFSAFHKLKNFKY